VCNFPSVIQQICFHRTQTMKLFYQCSGDSSLCKKSVWFHYQMTKSRCRQVSRPMFKYLRLLWTDILVFRISVQDNWLSNTSETEWDFNITIYLSVDKTFLSKVVSQFSKFPSIEFWCYCLDIFSVPTVLLLVTFRPSEEFCIILC